MMKRHGLPPALDGVYFDFHWSQAKLWALTIEPVRMEIAELEWSFALPVLASEPPAKMYDLCPGEILTSPARHPKHAERIRGADPAFPIHVMRWRGRWLVMDGFHRLLKLKLAGASHVLAVQVPESTIPDIGPDSGLAADFLAGELGRRDRS